MMFSAVGMLAAEEKGASAAQVQINLNIVWTIIGRRASQWWRQA